MLWFRVPVRFQWLSTRQRWPWCNAVSSNRPRSVCSNFAAFWRTDHENKYDDSSRKSDEDRGGNQHLAQGRRKFSGRRLGALLQESTAMRARRHFLADLLAAARTDGLGQSHGHILGPAQSAGMTGQRESAAVRSVRGRGLSTLFVLSGSDASGGICRSDRGSRANDATAPRASGLGAGILLLLENGIAFWAMKH